MFCCVNHGMERYISEVKTMNGLELTMGISLIAMAIFLVFSVLMQSGKDNKLSGTISGGTETFFGKSKGRSWDRVLSRLTTVIAVLFSLLVVAMYIIVSAMN